ncbi:MAG: TraB/GumN family protein [bacterium]
MNIEKISNSTKKIIFDNGDELFVVGTAHVSLESVNDVEEIINHYNPDTIAVELDADRLEVIKNRKRYEETDIINLIKQKKILFFAVQLALTAYQKKIAEKTGVTPGAEMKKAVDMAEEKGARLVTADRNISVTLKRLIRVMPLSEKLKILWGMFTGSEDDISEEKIEELKKQDAITAIISEMGDETPTVKKVLLDERDYCLAKNIMKNKGRCTVAVVGAAHVEGIVKTIKENKFDKKSTAETEYIPPPSRIMKIIPWIIPLLVILLFGYGFYSGNYEAAGEAAIYWILINGVLSAFGCLVALGHPLTVLSGFIAAPLTSLNPTIGAGIVTGFVQLFIVKPTVSDFESAGNDAGKITGWWKNRLTRILLVSIFSSIGSSIGSFAAFPFLMRIVG